MILALSPELADARLKARAVFPRATWLPGDDPPIGTRVADDEGHELGEVRGVCTAEEMRWWWFVARHDGRVSFEWPPTLRPADARTR